MRKYLKRIEVWQNQATDDTFGGNLVTEVKLSDSWCNIKSVPVNKYVDFGLDTADQSIMMETRWRNDLDYMQEGVFFKYMGKDWFPTRLYDMDLENEKIVIIATMGK